jgi:hypothetical protein
MANTLRIKRRLTGTADSPNILKNAELAFNEVGAGTLWYGKGSDVDGNATNIIPIAGEGAFVSLTANQSISGIKTVTGTLALTGATIDGFTTTGGVTIGGNLTVNGTTTSVSSTTLEVLDKNIELGKVATPTDTTADGGGISLLGTTTKEFKWLDANDAWNSSENLNLVDGKSYFIDGNAVLNETGLGSSVLSSSLTSVGTLTSGSWTATTIGTGYGGTGIAGGYQAGELLIGTSGGGLAKATLTAGTGVSIVNASGSITINASDQQTAGDGLDLTAGVFSVDLKANGGLVIESTELALDLGASSITGTLAVADGGTGQTSYTDGEILIGNSATGGLSKASIVGDDGITITNGNGTIEVDVDLKANGGLTIESGKIAMDLGASSITGTLAIGDGGTGATSASGARDSLGLTIGTNVQAWDTELDTLSGMSAGAAGALALLSQGEVEILDGATVTTAELNVIDGSNSATATTLALPDRLVVNDNGSMVQVALSDLVAFFENSSASGFSLDGGTF